jgi:hypothetical protein
MLFAPGTGPSLVDPGFLLLLLELGIDVAFVEVIGCQSKKRKAERLMLKLEN